jgi:hypothetical protein
MFQTIDHDHKIAEIRKALITKHSDLKEIFNNPDVRIVLIKATALQLPDSVTDSYFEKLTSRVNREW